MGRGSVTCMRTAQRTCNAPRRLQLRCPGPSAQLHASDSMAVSMTQGNLRHNKASSYMMFRVLHVLLHDGCHGTPPPHPYPRPCRCVYCRMASATGHNAPLRHRRARHRMKSGSPWVPEGPAETAASCVARHGARTTCAHRQNGRCRLQTCQKEDWVGQGMVMHQPLVPRALWQSAGVAGGYHAGLWPAPISTAHSRLFAVATWAILGTCPHPPAPSQPPPIVLPPNHRLQQPQATATLSRASMENRLMTFTAASHFCSCCQEYCTTSGSQDLCNTLCCRCNSYRVPARIYLQSGERGRQVHEGKHGERIAAVQLATHRQPLRHATKPCLVQAVSCTHYTAFDIKSHAQGTVGRRTVHCTINLGRAYAKYRNSGIPGYMCAKRMGDLSAAPRTWNIGS